MKVLLYHLRFWRLYQTPKVFRFALFEHLVQPRLIDQKVYPIESEILDSFLIKLEYAKVDSNVLHTKLLLDGISFRASKINYRGDTVDFISNYSERNEDALVEYKLLDAFFKLSNKSILDYDGMTELEQIQGYYDYGLPIKKVCEKPLEYRVWSSYISCFGDETKLEFISFLEQLPSDEPILFDLRNGSISYHCFNELLEELNLKKEIYCYGDEYLIALHASVNTYERKAETGEKMTEPVIYREEKRKKIIKNIQENTSFKYCLTKEEVYRAIFLKEDDLDDEK